MNTWGYLLPIAALLLLAGAMLYARFASRSRGKSLHHPPVEWIASIEADSLAPAEEADADKEASGVGESILRLDRHTAPAAEEGSARDRDYLDELQEAAAGLARLMRSSPVARTEPVVFAPAEEEAVEAAESEPLQAIEEPAEEVEIAEEAVAEAAVAEVLEAEPLQIAETEVAEEEEAVEVVAEAAATEFLETQLLQVVETEVAEELEEAEVVEAIEEELPSQPKSIRELLGETVAEQFDRIDEGLDALEALVLGIESGFATLALLERDEAMGTAEEPEVLVAAAA